MSRRTLAAACLLLLTLPVAPTAAAEDSLGACVSKGPPPTVSVGSCGPKVKVTVNVHLITGEDFSFTYDPCGDDCSLIVTLNVLLCSGGDRAETAQRLPPIYAGQGILGPGFDPVPQYATRFFDEPGGNVVVVETVLGCD